MSLMNCTRTNYLLSDFSFTESCTVSNLFNSFCMNLYSCQTWRFNNKKQLKAIHVAWRKCIRRIWKLNSKTHNDLLHHIKFIYNIINSEHSLHSRIALYSLYNGDTTLGENIRYFMDKYKMSYKDWYSPFYNINNYIDTYVINNCINSLHSGLAIKELCMARDGGKLENLDYSDCLTLIDLLCVS